MNSALVASWYDAFPRALQEEWEALAVRAATDSPFQTASFIRAAIAMAGTESVPAILMLRRADDNLLVGALALGRAIARIGPFSQPVFQSLSFRRFDLTALMFDPHHADLVTAAAAAALESKRLSGHEISLYGVPGSSPLLCCMPTTFRQRVAGPLWNADLRSAGGWEDVIRVAHQRRDIRRREKLLVREHGAYTVVWATEPTEANAMASDFVALHSVQQAAKGRKSVFASAIAASALSDYLAEAVPAGSADVGTLRLDDGRVLAAEILLYSRDMAYRYRTTYDMTWSRYGPGNILLGASVDRVIGRGYPTFELGWGTEPYKANWGTSVGAVCRVQAAPPRHRAIGYRVLRRLATRREHTSRSE